MKFDLVIGNPPFQHQKVKGSSGALWLHFIYLADRLINPNGFIVYVTPAAWLRLSSRHTKAFFLTKQVEWVRTDLQKEFAKIGSSFTAWIVKNHPPIRPTYFRDLDQHIDLQTCSGIPLKCPEGWSINQKIKEKHPKFNVVECNRNDFRRFTIDKNKHLYGFAESDQLKHKIMHTSSRFGWAACEPLDYHTPKVVMAYSGYAKPIFLHTPIGSIKDMSCHFITDKGEEFIKLLKSKLFLFYRLSQKSGGFNYLGSFRIPELSLDREWSDKDLYQYFNLNDKEIQIVEEFYDKKIPRAEK